MINKIITLLTILLTNQVILAEDLFHNCSASLGDKNYKVLNEYLLKQNESAIYCQRLNNHEFVYTTYRNFHYCDFKINNASECNEHEMGRWYPNLEIETRFNGQNGKNFILFKTNRLSRGGYDSGYQIFFFTPKNENQKGYQFISLEEVGEHNGLYSDEGEICSSLNDNEDAVEFIDKGYEILNNGEKNVGIRFKQKITSCKTKAISIKLLEYIWSGNKFIKK